MVSAGIRRRVRRLIRENAKILVGILAVLGFGAGVTLDVTTTWPVTMPLTANLVAGFLGAPLPILLALLFFDRLVTAESSRGWLLRNWDALQEDVVPVLVSMEAELAQTWPLDAHDVDADVMHLADLLEPLADQLPVGGHTLPEPIRGPLADVAALPPLDLEGVGERIRTLVTAVEMAAGQSDIPPLSETAIAVKTAANTLQAGIAGYGTKAELGVNRWKQLRWPRGRRRLLLTAPARSRDTTSVCSSGQASSLRTLGLRRCSAAALRATTAR